MLKNLERNWIKRNRPRRVPIYPIPFPNYTLKPHQERVRNYMRTHSRLLVVHGTGSGKTLTAAHVAKDYVDSNNQKNIVLVITPNSVQAQFRKSIATVIPGYSGVYFTTYGELPFFLNNLYKSRRERFADIVRHMMIIADEAHYISDGKGVNKIFSDVFLKAKKIMLMTGTPVKNEESDLLPYAKILNRNTSITAKDVHANMSNLFRCKVSVYDNPVVNPNFPNLIQPVNRKLINWNMSQISNINTTRKRKADVIASASANRMIRKSILSKKGAPSRANIAKRTKGITGGWATARAAASSVLSNVEPKFVEFMNILSQRPHKTIVYFKEYATLEKFEKFLKTQQLFSSQPPVFTYEIISGKTTANNRSRMMNANKANPSKKVVYLITDSAKEGLDFKGVRTVIFMDYPWTPANYNQIVGRARRYQSHINLAPQNRNVKVYELAYKRSDQKNTINMRSYSLVQSKRAEITRIMNVLRSLSIETLQCGPSPPRPQSARPYGPHLPRNMPRTNRVLGNKYALDPTTRIKYHLTNLNVPLNQKLSIRKSPANTVVSRGKRKRGTTPPRPTAAAAAPAAVAAPVFVFRAPPPPPPRPAPRGRPAPLPPRI